MRNRIWDWHDCFEPEESVFVAVHDSSLVRTFATRILDVVIPFAVSLPDVNFYSFNRLATCVFNRAENKTWFAIWVVGDLSAIGFHFSFMGMERPKNCALRTRRWLRMINTVDQKRQAEDV